MVVGSTLSRPFNWNPVCVEIRSIDTVQTKVHPVWRSAVPQKRRGVARVYEAQINLKGKFQDRKSRTERGDRTNTRGWILLRTVDLAPITSLALPVKGDKITKLYAGTVMELEVDYLIEEVRYESPLRGQPLLIYCEFERNREKTSNFSGGS